MFREFHTNKSHLVDHLQIMNGNSLCFVDANVNKFLYNKVMLCYNKHFYITKLFVDIILGITHFIVLF